MANFGDDTKSLYLASEEKIKEGFSALGDFLASGEAKEVLKIVGDVSKVASGVKLVVNIRNWHIAKKIARFVEGLARQPLEQEQFQKLEKKYGKDKVLKEVILSLDSMRDEKQASAFAYLFAALLRGDLDWKRFNELRNILEKIDPLALDDDFDGKEPTYRLVTVGLAYIQTVFDDVRVLPNGHLYNDFEKFIAIPYKESVK